MAAPDGGNQTPARERHLIVELPLEAKTGKWEAVTWTRILIVEDTPDNRASILRDLLTSAGI